MAAFNALVSVTTEEKLPITMLSKANSQTYIGLESLVHTKFYCNQAIPI